MYFNNLDLRNFLYIKISRAYLPTKQVRKKIAGKPDLSNNRADSSRSNISFSLGPAEN